MDDYDYDPTNMPVVRFSKDLDFKCKYVITDKEDVCTLEFFS